MAKKKETNPEPIISSIPVPPSDSALVIDLPDGQKLLIGKIETGTVIEVATWRGTGRPDSRTNRLMLGMSNENEINENEISNSPKHSSLENSDIKLKIKFYSEKVVQIIVLLLKKSLSKLLQLPKSDIFKNLNFGKYYKLALSKKKKDVKSSKASEAKLDDDFDADFQRILDQVGKRHKPSTGKTPNTGQTKPSENKVSTEKRPKPRKKISKRAK